MSSFISFTSDQFNRLFPFYFVINRDLRIISVGTSMAKLCRFEEDKKFNDYFTIPRPYTQINTLDDLKSVNNDLIILEFRSAGKLLLRGQFEYLHEADLALFVGSPWFDSMEQVRENNLVINDFARHDPLIDLLHVLKTQEITNDDLKQLITTINQQKNELKKANKEIHDIALFPTQNPDPLFRIDMEGNLLKMNPAAEKLASFYFQNRNYTRVEFFRMAAGIIDKKAERFFMETRVDHTYFSLVCVTLEQDGYVNIYGRNITQEKQTRDELRRSTELWKFALEGAGDGVWEYDFVTRKSFFSRQYKKMLGYEDQEFINDPEEWLQRIHPEDRGNIHQTDKQYSTKEITAHSREYRIRHKDGHFIWVLDRGMIVSYSADQTPGRMVGTHSDITERKKAEEKLWSQKEFYENILNNIPADIAVFSPRHEYLFVNPRGIKDPEIRQWLIGKRDEDYCILRNKPLQMAAERRALFMNVISSKRQKEWEEKILSPEGKETYLLRIFYPVLSPGGDITLVIGYGIDITERKKIEKAIKANEEKYRSIIANMNLGLMELDSNQNLLFANQHLLAMAGVGGENITGSNIAGLLSSRSLELVNAKAFSRKMGISEADELMVTVNGENRWWLISSAPKINEEGEMVGSIVICLDISDRKELEKELIIARENAEQLAKTKEIFLANMSHEIRTPINAILGLSNQLTRHDLTVQQQGYLSAIQSATNSLLVIINDILDLSKIEAGKLSLNTIGFEWKSLLFDTFALFAYKAEEKGIRLTNSYTDNNISPVLMGDPYRLSQVLTNLIGNAIKFTEEGKVDVQIKLAEDKTDSQLIEIGIIDTGIGMDESFVSRIFEKFIQENDSLNQKQVGTGLGMSICRELVSLMGGDIRVESKKGEGTKVILLIGFRKGAENDLVKKSKTRFKKNFLQHKKILVVDDNEMNRLVASTIVKNYGATVLESVNGQEAVGFIAEQDMDIVLMDIQMPVLNGYEATRKLRQSGKIIPVIALTAYASKGEKEKCLAAGMNDYISKPFNEEVFLMTIARWLGLSDQSIVIPAPITNTPPLFTLSKLQEISRGNKAFIEKMIQLFIDHFPAASKEISEAYSVNDLAKVKALAHRIKPMIDNLEIASLTTEIRQIEKLAGEGNQSADLEQYIRKLDRVISQVVEQLQLYV